MPAASSDHVGGSRAVSQGTLAEMWRMLSEGGASEANRRAALEGIETAVSAYVKAQTIAEPSPARKLQRRNAKRFQDAVLVLRGLAKADAATFKRLCLGSAPKKAGKNRDRKDGKQMLDERIDGLLTAAAHAVKRAGRESGGGRRSEDPARRVLVADLAEIWRDATGAKFKPSRTKKSSASPVNSKIAARTFVELAFNGLGLEQTFSQLSNLLTEGLKELKRRDNESSESEESEANA